MTDISFDFSELPDGPFPDGIGVGVLHSDGGDSIIEESAPETYYFVEGGLGVFSYLEDGLNQHGLIASAGILEGKDASLSLIFANPLADFRTSLTEAKIQIGLGYRGVSGLEWVGGLVESYWNGSWSPKWKLSAVEVSGDTISYLEEEENDEVAYQEENELTVSIIGNEITVAFNGFKQLVAETDFQGDNNIILWIRCYLDADYIPLIKEISATALNSGKNFSIKEMPGHFVPPPTSEAHHYRVPVYELMKAGYLKALTHNSWKFTQDVTVTWPDEQINFRATRDAVVVAERQTLVDADIQTCRFKYS